jgi:hypothetical protein
MWIDRERHTIKTDKMKKAGLFLIFVSAIFLNGYSQNIDDALRYSQIFYTGTARFMSMGGAYTALGGDFSAISLNPAGAGIFRSFELSITPQIYYNNTSSLWNKSSASDFNYISFLSQAGVVTNLIKPKNETGLVNLNLAYSYNRTNNFNENLTIKGISDNSSMADYWVSISEGKTKMQIPDVAWAANQTWLLDTLSGSSTLYGTVFSRYGDSTNSKYGQTIKRTIENTGYTGEHSFSISGNFSNKFFLGVAIGISTLSYTGQYEHLESDDQSVIYDFKNFTYTDFVNATGTGFSMKIGTIFKPIDYLRIGLALHSPVVYRINENFYDDITSNFDIKVDNIDSYSYYNNSMIYKYTFTTPFRALGGVAVQIKKLGFISADYEFVDYRLSRFSKPSVDYNYASENEDIRNKLKTSSNIRIGAEVRLKSISLRSGYSYYGKVFNENELNKNLNYNAFSFGIGLRQENYYFDLAYTTLAGKSKYNMYDYFALDPATVETSKNMFAITIGYKFK